MIANLSGFFLLLLFSLSLLYIALAIRKGLMVVLRYFLLNTVLFTALVKACRRDAC